MTREELETLAKETISAELYYELCDFIDVTTDDELRAFIACNGNYELELKANT
jgi:hypothetical protein